MQNRQDDSFDREYTLRDVLPGEPEVDYPIFARAPKTNFKCPKYGKDMICEKKALMIFICFAFLQLFDKRIIIFF
jgi:hypothetical protein